MFVISVLVVVTWRGVWGIFDLTFYTDNTLYSAWGSTVRVFIFIFMFIVYVLLLSFFQAVCVCDRFEQGGREVVSDVLMMIAYVGT